MKMQTSVEVLVFALFIAVIAVMVFVLWNSVSVPTLMATVSWNG